MSQSSAGNVRVWLLIAGVAVLILVSVGLAGVLYLALHGNRPSALVVAEPGASHLDKMLGTEPVAGIDEEGFFGPETSRIWKDETYRWTNGAAKLVIPLGNRPPQAVFIKLGLPVPRTVQLRVQINGQAVCDEKIAMGRDWTRTFDVSKMDLGKAMTIEIVSDTFVPAEAHENSTDPRSLGVAVRGIQVMSGEQDFTNMLLGAKLVPGVSEEGFWYQEYDRDQPCRWTNGSAKLTVPVHGAPPRTLSLVCLVPNRPDFRVEVKVNGQLLFDDVVKGNGDWSIELPLADVAIEREARIELISSTVVPAESGTGSADNRKLGLRVKKMLLVR